MKELLRWLSCLGLAFLFWNAPETALSPNTTWAKVRGKNSSVKKRRRKKRHLRKRRRRYRKTARIRLPRRYRSRWGRACRHFGIDWRTCRKIWRDKDPKKIHALAMRLMRWWKKKLDGTTSEERARLESRRQKYFRVDRWWWDRYKRDKEYKLIDAVDRLLQTRLKSYPAAEYRELLMFGARLIGHPGLSLPRETALCSRLSRWMNRRKAPKVAAFVTQHMSQIMLKRQECPWWYLVFLGNFSPQKLQALSTQISPSWCTARKVHQQLRFQSYQQIGQRLKQWSQTHKKIARLHNFGRSGEGRPLWALQIGSRQRRFKQKQKSILLVGNQHGDEHVGAEVLMDFLERTFKRYKRKDRRVRAWMKTRQIWVVPVLNPDGKMFDLLGGMIKWWRYNRVVQADGQIGVDLNRNFGYKWKKWRYYGGGRITLPGKRPFSEPETEALRLLSKRLPRLTAILDVHQYGSVLLLPYAFSRTQLPTPYQQHYEALAHYLTRTNHYRYYPAHRLYPHQGTLGDWGFGEYKALSLVLELGRKQYIGPKRMNRVIRSNRELIDRFVQLSQAPYQVAKTLFNGKTPSGSAGN